jgi:septin family protein
MAGARLARLGEIAGELGADDLASDAHAEQRRLEEARFLVACVGQFKRGKSTLINALVGQSAQCHPESGGAPPGSGRTLARPPRIIDVARAAAESACSAGFENRDRQ